ncbi:hypothetical protein OIU77_004473 [Salix suchowensis]|uniref:XPG-I domain-containing protein n=1 Tax=Salix suchowensis TaxID=1278906 RepID=A0ABQ9AUH8_9ROSI|nr:hypothetical protein OIU77_004473 [Salix suchowensis]
MFTKCQELLHMFGLPYIIAPMEAEAPCAFMKLANYVDGTVTDDADVFLFGARSVYKNIFDDRKYVETYFMKDPAILGKFDVQTGLGVRKKESKVGGSEANCIGNGMERTNPSSLNVPQAHEEKQSADHAQRNVSKNRHTPSFPSEAVISAYSYPYVDKSTEPFTWGKPALHSLHS